MAAILKRNSTVSFLLVFNNKHSGPFAWQDITAAVQPLSLPSRTVRSATHMTPSSSSLRSVSASNRLAVYADDAVLGKSPHSLVSFLLKPRASRSLNGLKLYQKSRFESLPY